MVDYNEIKTKLLKEIENEKGFSFKKLLKIIELNALYSNAEHSVL